MGSNPGNSYLAVGQLLERVEDGDTDEVERRFVVEAVNTRKHLLLQPIGSTHVAQSLQSLGCADSHLIDAVPVSLGGKAHWISVFKQSC